MDLKDATLETAEEWHLWKTAHDKTYSSNLEELEKHIVWSSNKAYVNQHNINAKNGIYSYEVKLNYLADLVSPCQFCRVVSYITNASFRLIKSTKTNISHTKEQTGA